MISDSAANVDDMKADDRCLMRINSVNENHSPIMCGKICPCCLNCGIFFDKTEKNLHRLGIVYVLR